MLDMRDGLIHGQRCVVRFWISDEGGGRWDGVRALSRLRFPISASSFIRREQVRLIEPRGVNSSISFFGHINALSKLGRCKVISVFGMEGLPLRRFNSVAARMGTRGQLDLLQERVQSILLLSCQLDPA